ELRRVELLLPPVEAVIGTEVELFPALVLVEAGVELRRDHRLRRPAPEELVTPLAVEDGREPGLAGGAPEEIVWPRHRVPEREVELPDEVHQDGRHVLSARL